MICRSIIIIKYLLPVYAIIIHQFVSSSTSIIWAYLQILIPDRYFCLKLRISDLGCRNAQNQQFAHINLNWSSNIYLNILIMVRILLLTLLLIALTKTATNHNTDYNIKDFGMNKPHLLFHLGDRHPVSVNYGFGYWLANPEPQDKQHFEKTRMWYENTKNGLYVNMISHDGQNHIHQEIQDRTYSVNTHIKYQLREKDWEQHINIARDKKGKYQNHSVYWFTYMTVQNNDPKLVDNQKYSTPIYLVVDNYNKNKAQVTIQRVDKKQETIYIQSKQKLNVFGLSMNISESYDIRSTINEVKHIIEIQKYKKVTRSNDSKIVQWENGQVKLIRNNQWTNSKYVVLVFYGQSFQDNQIFVGNKTTPFDTAYFKKESDRLNQLNFPVEKYPKYSSFLNHMLYNLYGGTAFYYGILYTQNSLLVHQLDYSYTFTPSRLIFPRGFLWDDGFHLSVAVHYNPKLALNIIHNWMRKIDLFGWIGREQIRGYQMSSLMPEIKFVYQDIFEMNPPTLLLPILTFIDKYNAGQLSSTDSIYLDQLLQQNFWKLQKWYRYFVKTQSHNNLMQNEAINRSIKYRWRCKDDCERGNFMGSGLDDYPRTATPTQISKQHVDLMSWIYFFSEGLQKIASHLQQQKPMKYYRSKKQQMKQKIIEQCLDNTDLLFKDQSVAGKNQYINQLVTRTGYITLFPFFTGILQHNNFQAQQQQQKVKQVRDNLIQVMADQKILMSQDGIRSLSISDPLYGTEDNYWRGAVWMPINYLILRACRKFYWEDKSARELYAIVRERVINSVHSNWQQSGYLFQNYHEGKGQRGFPFYGWTSLLVNIITQNY